VRSWVLNAEQSATGTTDVKCLRAERSADRHGASSAKIGAIQTRCGVRRVERGAIHERQPAQRIGKGAILDRCEALKCCTRSNPSTHGARCGRWSNLLTAQGAKCQAASQIGDWCGAMEVECRAICRRPKEPSVERRVICEWRNRNARDRQLRNDNLALAA